MSRIGNNPVPLPGGVEIEVDGPGVSVKGAKGTLERTFDSRISFNVGEGEIEVVRANDERETRALHGLSRALQGQGKSAEADRIQSRFRRAWARADAPTKTSCACIPKT